MIGSEVPLQTSQNRLKKIARASQPAAHYGVTAVKCNFLANLFVVVFFTWQWLPAE